MSNTIERNAAWHGYRARARVGRLPECEQARVERAFIAGWNAHRDIKSVDPGGPADQYDIDAMPPRERIPS